MKVKILKISLLLLVLGMFCAGCSVKFQAEADVNSPFGGGNNNRGVGEYKTILSDCGN